MKTCAKCSVSKPLDAFNRRALAPDGFNPRCRDCVRADRAPHKERDRKKRMESYYADHENNIKRQREYQAANRGIYRAASANWRHKNPLMMRVSQDIWYSKNKDKNAASASRYYTRKRNRCPKWLTKEQHEKITSFYAIARWLTEQSGVAHQVDHIVPLHGKNVCGLHVPWNLQILTSSENSSKGNRHE